MEVDDQGRVQSMAIVATTEKDDAFLDASLTASKPFQNVEWEDLLEDDVEITKAQPAIYERKKRKRHGEGNTMVF
ncbi:unnamed protein product [Cuscuta europaea]|uniref:Uncharacterized protein n=1 Tax=Cuscuta europaea TaxID=41803 RepID=A0A9P1A2Z6_CUSEU|nr:unnamed protein product [Cuscuta europaea]